MFVKRETLFRLIVDSEFDAVRVELKSYNNKIVLPLPFTVVEDCCKTILELTAPCLIGRYSATIYAANNVPKSVQNINVF